MKVIGATRDFSIELQPSIVKKERPQPSARAQYLASLIPVYPDEISQKDLKAKAKVPDGVFYALLSVVGNSYLLCEDGGRYSLLRRGLSYVD